jgi:hypothetical protein
MLNTTLLYSTHSCVKKACTHPSKWTRKYCHTIGLPLLPEWMIYIYIIHTKKSFNPGLPTLPKEIHPKHPDSTTQLTIHSFIYIYIYLASEVPWTPSILREPTNQKVLRHRTPTRVAKSKSGLQSLDTIRLWEVMIRNTKKILRKKKEKKDFYYTLRRSGLSFITD